MKRTTTFGLLLFLSFSILLVQSAKYERKLHRVPTHFIEKDDTANYNFYNKYYSTKHKTTIGNAVPMFGGFLVVGYYYANITIGTPAVNYNLIIDTGSSNIVLNVDGCASCGTGPTYNPNLSSSSSAIPFGSSTCDVCSPPDYFSDTSICAFQQPFSYNSQCGFGITYGGGGTALYGYLVNDIVCLGPANDGFCVDEQPIGLITNQYPSDLYTGFPLQGIFGMAYIMNSCNPTCVDVLYDTVSEELSLPNYFGMCLSASNGGSIDLGYVNASKYTGDLQYTPINMERWFNIILEDIQIGGISIEVPKSLYYTTNDVIGTFVDSGTSIILFNAFTYGEFQKVFEKNFPSLPSLKTLFTEECVLASSIPNLSTYPDISFVFNNENGQSFSLPVPPSSYLYEVTVKNENFYCLGVQSVSSIGVVLGDVFMENYYVVFDKENSRLGFAPVVASAC